MWMIEWCEETESLTKQGKLEELYDVARSLTSAKPRKTCKKGIMNKEGNIITSLQEKTKVWKECVQELYCSEKTPKLMNVNDKEDCEETDKGQMVMVQEVWAAIADMRDGKAVGCDELPIEVAKALGEGAIQKLIALVNRVYETGK